MQADFWLQRWSAGQIGFHQSQVNQDLQQYWSLLKVATGTRVLVPLCGKSEDMNWLIGTGLSCGGCRAVQGGGRGLFQ